MDPNQPNIDARYRTMLTIWGAICMSVITLLILVYLTPAGTKGEQKLGLILNCAGIVPVGISFLLKQQILAQAIAEQKIDRVQAAYVVSFALCEASALLSVIDHFVNGSRYFYVGFIFGVLGLLLHFPQKGNLLAASSQQF